MKANVAVKGEIWYPCSNESPLDIPKVNSQFKIVLVKDPVYELVNLSKSFDGALEGFRVWVHFSGSAVRHLDHGLEDSQRKKIAGDMHLAWGVTTQTELKKLKYNYNVIDHTQDEKKWVNEIKTKTIEAYHDNKQ